MKTHFLRTMEVIPSSPYAFKVSRPEMAENTSFEKMLVTDKSESEGDGDGGIEKESSRVELEEILEKRFQLYQVKIRKHCHEEGLEECKLKKKS